MDVRTTPKPPTSIEINGVVIQLPTKRIVCPICNGKGHYVDPAIDSQGISPAKFAEDPDFAEAYYCGIYDVRCDYCKGQNTVDVVDESALTEEQRKLYWEQIDDEISYQRERESERRMGA